MKAEGRLGPQEEIFDNPTEWVARHIRRYVERAALWPDYDRYQAKTSRDTPVVILERR